MMAIVKRSLAEVQKRAQARRAPLAPWSDEKIRKAAAGDPDTWLPSEAQLREFKPARAQARQVAEDGRKFENGE